MNIIDATWEKRNLGVSTQEMTININDSLEEVKKGIEQLNAEYQVIKVPAGMIDVMWALEDKGFRYIESAIHVTNNLKNCNIPPVLKRIDDSVDYQPMNESDLKELFNELENGLFYTDRIAVDPFFSKKQANKRYIGWLNDEIKRGTEMFKYIYKGENVGFFSFKKIDEGVYYPFLAGIYGRYQKSPIGMVYINKPLIEAHKRGAKLISTYISTNNSNAFRMHVQFGFEFKEINNIYVKHIDKE